ncbi:hypothetical protein COCSUDRAFT_59481 [Coccomyxa subellipsoidea C-169]|uniref:Uncharacterized protein n=1 Tax=Coccomyxa subellipsoidea (strain C-169) TaxID=574566 RepID=I0Z8L8_COCSC|nr:hypothetical protein COCSUDRAFT_59481 [Coccomyxa subellipsoidea C-169]EIE26987.1 hypothetical protein COCSUDRAFT_59481 [Coccomyxa subellipsoidea C-169]|eukprot:XP_005651531.1 hypothetical protein COCSUDRAFT_59481 [Coccomyxa subellipsoidea C-169]
MLSIPKSISEDQTEKVATSQPGDQVAAYLPPPSTTAKATIKELMTLLDDSDLAEVAAFVRQAHEEKLSVPEIAAANKRLQDCAADLAQRLELPSQLVEYLAGLRVTDIGGTDLNFRAYISHMSPEYALNPGYDKIACKWLLVDLPCEGNEGRAKRSVRAAVYKDDWDKHGQHMENETLLVHDAGQ